MFFNKKKEEKYIEIKDDIKDKMKHNLFSKIDKKKKTEEEKKKIHQHIWQGIEEAYSKKKLPKYMILGKKEYQKEMEEKKEKDKNKEEEKEKIEEKQKTIEKKLNGEETIETVRKKKIEEIIGEAAANIALNAEADVIVSLEKSEESTKENKLLKVSIFRKKTNKKFEKVEYNTPLRKSQIGNILPIKDILSEAIAKEYIKKNDRVICVEDENVSMGFRGMLFIFDVDELFFNISLADFPETIPTEVVEAIITIAQEISAEGREGKHIGTTFIIGNEEELKPYTRQIIINPFRNYPEEERKITDPNLKETIKSFAQLDGAFIINEEGIIITAGAMINNNIPGIEPVYLPGFGTRHNSAATLTKATNAIAIVVSSSGGAIRVFKDGKLLMRIT